MFYMSNHGEIYFFTASATGFMISSSFPFSVGRTIPGTFLGRMKSLPLKEDGLGELENKNLLSI